MQFDSWANGCRGTWIVSPHTPQSNRFFIRLRRARTRWAARSTPVARSLVLAGHDKISIAEFSVTSNLRPATRKTMQPLQFRPILKRMRWGGRRLGTLLGKRLGDGADYAESWEIADCGSDQTT